MADKSDCTSEDVSDAPELDPQIIKLETALATVFTGVDLLFSMTDQIPTVLVPTESLHDLCIFLKTNEDYDSKMLSCMAGVDYVDYCQILYVLYSINKNCTVGVKCNINYDSRVQTVSDIWKAGDWYEREIHDLYGIEFEGHGDMSPLLLYDGFEGYPGKKDFPFYDYQEY